MAKLVNRAYVNTATTGTGTITLGSPLSGQRTFAAAGVSDGDVVRYVIEDGSDWEIGTGTYTASGTTLTRTVSESSNAGAAINLSGSAVVYVSATAEDIPVAIGDGQTWAASGKGIITTYQNTSGRTIAVSVLCNAAQFNTLEIKVGTNASGSSNPIVARFLDFTTASGIGLTVSALVPDGHYYYVDTFYGIISSFMELT